MREVLAKTPGCLCRLGSLDFLAVFAGFVIADPGDASLLGEVALRRSAAPGGAHHAGGVDVDALADEPLRDCEAVVSRGKRKLRGAELGLGVRQETLAGSVPARVSTILHKPSTMNDILCSYFILRIFRNEFSKSGFVILLTHQRGYFVILLYGLDGIWRWLATVIVLGFIPKVFMRQSIS